MILPWTNFKMSHLKMTDFVTNQVGDLPLTSHKDGENYNRINILNLKPA